MDNLTTINKYFYSNRIDPETVLISTKLQFISDFNVPYLLEALQKTVTIGESNYLLDFSTIDSIDSVSIKLISKEINKINQNGNIIKLIITDNQPVISYSIGDELTVFNHIIERKDIAMV